MSKRVVIDVKVAPAAGSEDEAARIIAQAVQVFLATLSRAGIMDVASCSIDASVPVDSPRYPGQAAEEMLAGFRAGEPDAERVVE